ncbi:hypothetical protein HOY80DRAFT_1053336 [Tuber brumale]|nr:hypothetical protein HOY80DRAFT_1053336 [Tuber brumale]
MPNHFIVTEWKAINIDFIDPGVSLVRHQKADLIARLDINGVVDLKFNKKEKFKKAKKFEKKQKVSSFIHILFL